MTLRAFSVSRSLEAAFYFLLGTPQLVSSFPLMQPYYPDTAYMGVTIVEPFICGLLPSCPFLLLAFVYLVKSFGERRLVWWSVLALVLLGIFVAAFDGNAAGILGRYQQDFGILFGFAFALALFKLEK